MKRVLVSCAIGGLLAVSSGDGNAMASTAHRSPRCSTATDKVAATLGLWTGVVRPDRYDDTIPSIDGLSTGLGTRSLLAAVTQRKHGRVSRLELCSERTLIARLPRPAPDAIVGGVSGNGTYVAWRTWRPGRGGDLLVGRQRGSRIVGIRKTTVPKLARSDAREGTIVVLPTGEAAWSIPIGKRAGIWLWPRGKPARRIALAAAPKDRRSWDIRILDAGHVWLVGSTRIARYGPATPGQCPTTYLSDQHDLGSAHVSQLSWTHFPESSFYDYYDFTTLVCDKAVGDYSAVETTRGSAGLHDYQQTAPAFVANTAGTTVIQQYGYGSSGTYRSYTTATVAPGRPATVLYGPGILQGSAITAAPPPMGTTTPRTTAQLIPGAAAWIGSGKRDDDPTRDVWLADADGPRVVGHVQDTDLYSSGTGPNLTLTPSSFAWTTPDGTRTVPVRPRPDDPVSTATLTTPRTG